VLTPLPADLPDAQERHAVFLQTLRQLGWTEGGNNGPYADSFIDRPVSDDVVGDRRGYSCDVSGRWAGKSMHGRNDPTPE
jgi:hypothetical protein